MWHVLIWGVTLLGLGLWSLLVWAGYEMALLAANAPWAQVLEQMRAWGQAQDLPPPFDAFWLWFLAEAGVWMGPIFQDAPSWLQGLLQWAGSAFGLIAVVVWAVVAVPILLVAGLLSLLAAVARAAGRPAPKTIDPN